METIKSRIHDFTEIFKNSNNDTRLESSLRTL